MVSPTPPPRRITPRGLRDQLSPMSSTRSCARPSFRAETSLAAQLTTATRAAATAPQPAPRQKKWLTSTSVFATVVAALLVLGWRVPTERYITPTRGFGYALGIIGGSLMLLLFLYSARKRIPWLKFMGPAAGWFRYHMVLGVLGPLCILYHCQFRSRRDQQQHRAVLHADRGR